MIFGAGDGEFLNIEVLAGRYKGPEPERIDVNCHREKNPSVGHHRPERLLLDAGTGGPFGRCGNDCRSRLLKPFLGV